MFGEEDIGNNRRASELATLGCQKSLKFEFRLRIPGTSACRTNRHMLSNPAAYCPMMASHLRPDSAALSRSHSRGRSSLIKDAIVTRIMSCRGCPSCPPTVRLDVLKDHVASLAAVPWIGLRPPQVSAVTVIAFAPCACAPVYCRTGAHSGAVQILVISLQATQW